MLVFMKTSICAAVQRASQIAGSKAALAKAIDVTPQTVQQWGNGERPVPAIRACKIERAFGLDRRLFRPDDWRDHWPELASVPLREFEEGVA